MFGAEQLMQPHSGADANLLLFGRFNAKVKTPALESLGGKIPVN